MGVGEARESPDPRGRAFAARVAVEAAQAAIVAAANAVKKAVRIDLNVMILLLEGSSGSDQVGEDAWCGGSRAYQFPSKPLGMPGEPECPRGGSRWLRCSS